MKQLFLTILIYLLVPFFAQTYCHPLVQFSKSPSELLPETFKFYSDSLNYKIINGINNTYGYDIYKHNQKLIHQPSIPCIKGNKGFVKKEDAKKIALLVIQKIRNGDMPPTVTIEEMRKEGVLK